MTTRTAAPFLALALALPAFTFAQSADAPPPIELPPATSQPDFLRPAPAYPEMTMQGPSFAPLAPTLGNEPLSAIRGDQPLTTNAMLGYINSQPVYAMDLIRPLNKSLQNLASSARTLDEFRRGAAALIANQLETLEHEIFITSAAENTLTEHDHEIINAVLEKQKLDLISKNGGSIPAADKALAATGSSVDKEMAERRRQLIVNLYLSKNLSPKIIVTYPMVRDAYEKDPKRWQEETQIELYQLTLPVARWLLNPTETGKQGTLIDKPTDAQIAAAENQAMATANEIVARIKKGPDTPQLFAQLVEDNDSRDAAASKGGRLAGMKKGSLTDKRLEDFAFSLPAHSVGTPLLLRDPNPKLSRVVIVKIGDRQDARVIPFAEAQAQLKKELWDRQSADLEDEYFRKLRDSGSIESVDQMIPIAVDTAIARYATDR